MGRQRIIAVDFDGTITDYSPFPITGKLRPEAVKYLNLLNEKGYDLVLWCARKGDDYNNAVALVKQWNLPVRIPKKEVGKMVADFYIDDKSCLGKINWRRIYKYIIRTYKN